MAGLKGRRQRHIVAIVQASRPARIHHSLPPPPPPPPHQIPLLDKVPDLRVVMEHITTADAAEFVAAAPPNVAATVTPQHMLLNRNALFVVSVDRCTGLACNDAALPTAASALPALTAQSAHQTNPTLQKGLRPHNYCLPVLKRERHREAVAAAATSGSAKFFLGTDSAPHARHAKEAPCGCAGVFSAPIALALYATAFEQVQICSQAGFGGLVAICVDQQPSLASVSATHTSPFLPQHPKHPITGQRS